MLPDGVHLNLSFRDYLAQKRMGSSQKGTLWLHGEGFYWKYLSPYAKPSSSSPEQLFGQVLHAILLEGLAAYETRYVVEPSKLDYPEALFTIPQIKEALAEASVYPKGASKFAKEDWAEAAEIYLPDRVVWDNVVAEFYRRQKITGPDGEEVHREGLSAEQDFMARAMWELAIENRPGNEEMRELLSVGSEFPILAEVSVLYSDEDGLRHSARFDKMLPTAIVDLKTLGNWQGRDLLFALDDHIKKNAYDVQLADYQIARRKAFEMVLADEDNLHGGTEEERDHFMAMAHWAIDHPKPAWAWIWYQKPEPSGRAPVLLPLREEWGGPYHRAGFRKRHAAIETYKRCMARFGPDRPWGRVEPTHWVAADHGSGEPHITLGMYNWGPDDEVEGEREHFE